MDHRALRAGGGTDVVARVIAPKLSQQLGQNVIIDNRTGASGNVGAEIVARATPDGYTVIMGNVSSHAINASVFKLPYDPVKDFAAVSVVAIAANVLVVHPSFAAKSVRELIAAAAAAPARSIMRPPATAAQRISRVSCSSCWPRSN